LKNRLADRLYQEGLAEQRVVQTRIATLQALASGKPKEHPTN